MANVIRKYKIDVDNPEMRLPAGAEVLHVALQEEHLYMWVKVNPTVESNKEISNKTIYVVGTDEVFKYENANFKHLSTVVVEGFAWHVFEVQPHPYYEACS